MNILEAQRTRVVRVPSLLDVGEVALLLALREQVQASDAQATLTFQDDVNLSQRGNWETVYIHSQGAFRARLPEVHAKLCAAVRAADASEGWSLLSGDFNARTCEVHTVADGGTLPEPKHYDSGSLVTIDVMLAQPGEFDGGTFRTLEADDQFLRYPEFVCGDAMIFVSHKYHGVEPVTRGVRRVCVTEFWSGEERTCPHRCKRRAGACHFSRKKTGAAEGGNSSSDSD